MLDAFREFDINGAFDVEGVGGFTAGQRKVMTMGWLCVRPQGGRISEIAQSQRFVFIDFLCHARLEETVAFHELKNEFLAFAGLFGMFVRPIGVGALRKSAEKRRFGAIQRFCVQSKIINGGGLDAVDFSAERNSVEIFRENFTFGMELFHLAGFRGLNEFGLEGALSGTCDGDKLHGNGRSSGDDSPIGKILPCRTCNGLEIDAVMLVKMRIFGGQNDVDGFLGDLFQWDVEAPLIIVGAFDVEEFALPVVIGTAGSLFFQIRKWIRAVRRRKRPCRPCGDAKHDDYRTDDDGQQAFLTLDFHCFYSISKTESVVKMALRSGAYMASTNDGGVMYLPRVTARAW